MEDRTAVDGAVTRRQALRDIGVAGIGLGALGGGLDALLAAPAFAASKTGSLEDIEHVIILMQENRSFDHYFGTYSGVRGFGDKTGRRAFFQKDTAGKTIHPFRLQNDCIPDLTHDWGPQHRAWNHGQMDQFVRAHQVGNGADPPGVGVETMAYQNASDVPVYRALANAFTLCDAYYCSVIGPTDPNRLMSMSASLDPAGTHGGPLLETLLATRPKFTGKFTWTTMPERLQARGVSWKIYSSPQGGVLDNVLTYFKAYKTGSTLANLAFKPTYPNDFLADLAAGRLPKVSWLLTGIGQTEHPEFSTPSAGEAEVLGLVNAIISHPKTWEKTALFITWDENGGFFDHVPPLTPPKGTKGEFVTVPTLPAAAQGIRGPIGLGFRVPMIVVSPFSRGGLVCSDTLDHTSTLRFIETRFGVEVPNLTAWRRANTGDLTSAFNFAAAPQFKRPALPSARKVTVCSTLTPPKVPNEPFPKQAPGKRGKPSGIVCKKKKK